MDIWRDHIHNVNPFFSVDRTQLGIDMLLSDDTAEDGSDLQVLTGDLAEEEGLDHYDKSVVRSIATAQGSHALYVQDAEGVYALDEDFGSDVHRDRAALMSTLRIEERRKSLLKVILSNPLVAGANVSYRIDETGVVTYDVEHWPVDGSNTFSTSYRSTLTGFVPV